MSTIIATGGGAYEKGETEKIDLELLRLCSLNHGRSNPKMLYFSTAGDNEPKGSEDACAYFSSLGFEVQTMSLILDMPSFDEIRKAVFSSDCVYIGGGDLIRLVHTMRSLKVDMLLKEASEKGVVLSGISAGASCWFDYAQSDSHTYYDPSATGYIRFPCFGVIHALCVPHYGTKRKADIRERIAGGESFPVVGLENGTAIVWQNGICRTLIAKPQRRVHIYYPVAESTHRIIRPHENEEFELF